jgi:hypothetical protein
MTAYQFWQAQTKEDCDRLNDDQDPERNSEGGVRFLINLPDTPLETTLELPSVAFVPLNGQK